MSADNHQELLRQITELARSGKRDQARELVEQILGEDDENVRAWTWLYRLSDDVDEKRIALTTILQLDPTNARARQALDRIEGRTGQDDDEVMPGISRRQLLLFGGGGLGVLLLLILVVALIVSGNNAQRTAAIATQTAAEVNPTRTFEAAQNLVLTEEAATAMALETQLAITSPTPSPTTTREGPPTLPPLFTPTPSFTPIVTPTPLQPPSGVGGAIVGWGGSDAAQTGNLPLLLIDISSGEITTIGGTGRGAHAAAASRTRIVYTRNYRDLSVDDLQFVNPAQALNEPLAARYQTQLQFNEGRMAQFAPGNPTLMAFSATSVDNMTLDIYLFDFAKMAIIDGPDPVTRVTTDEFTYTFPTISPDGTEIIAVRQDLRTGSGSPATDLVRIDIASGEQTMLTNDGEAVIETMPTWSPDGAVVLYAAATEENPTHDIFMRGLTTFTETLNVTRTDAQDEIYPTYDPSSRYIAYASDRRDTYDIYILDTQTNEIFQLTDGDVEDYYPGAWVE
jgi:hypothetical protein